MSAPWFAIQHVPYERPGSIAEEAAELGIDLRAVHAYRGEPLPSLDQLGGLVVMGGPMSVNDALPHLRAELDLVGEAIAVGIPVLGVCLGAQLIAKALGAEVFPGPEEEIGVGGVELTGEGRADPVLGPSGPTVPVFHWHGETFELPEGSASLARTESYPNQAFRIGPACLALQFHSEVTPALIDSWRPRLPADLDLHRDELLRVESTGRALIARFLAAALPNRAETPR